MGKITRKKPASEASRARTGEKRSHSMTDQILISWPDWSDCLLLTAFAVRARLAFFFRDIFSTVHRLFTGYSLLIFGERLRQPPQFYRFRGQGCVSVWKEKKGHESDCVDIKHFLPFRCDAVFSVIRISVDGA